MRGKASNLLRRGVLAVLLAPRLAAAFGPDGHRIAGLLAEPLLCPAAQAQVQALGRGASLAELGVWADEVRSSPQWRDSGPWHYMNVPDPTAGGDPLAAARNQIARFRHPPEGDVLAAIARFRSELADRTRSRARRLDALRFLTHFVVDVHQPLHVGRASDRGGNDVRVQYGGTVVNLHRFWDTDVIELRHMAPQRYARRLAPRIRPAAAAARSAGAPEDWAAESLALRATVYDFPARASGGRAIVLGSDYVAAAERVTDERLVQAAERLAATLNGAFCAGGAARRLSEGPAGASDGAPRLGAWRP